MILLFFCITSLTRKQKGNKNEIMMNIYDYPSFENYFYLQHHLLTMGEKTKNFEMRQPANKISNSHYRCLLYTFFCIHI